MNTSTPIKKESLRQKINLAFSHLIARQDASNWLLVLVFIASFCGLLLVSSASMFYAETILNNPLHFVKLHIVYLCLGIGIAFIAYKIPTHVWFQHTVLFWLISLLLLVLVFFFPSVNGSYRWINMGGFTIQSSEIAKFTMVLYTAEYVVRRNLEVRFGIQGFARLLFPLGLTLFLILLEPDFGASVVICFSVMVIFFLAGAPIKHFLVLTLTTLMAGFVAIAFSSYRKERVLSFLDPFDDPFGTDFQPRQSLLAFFHGGWFGNGLGHSIQKITYLPEAHTDFLFAIYAEEFGFVGVVGLLTIELLIVACCMYIGYQALKKRNLSSGFLVYGISAIFLIQVFVNAGMNMVLIPTKGLTMPFFSYGGSSLLMCMAMIGITLRIAKETKLLPDPQNMKATQQAVHLKKPH